MNNEDIESFTMGMREALIKNIQMKVSQAGMAEIQNDLRRYIQLVYDKTKSMGEK